MAGRAKPQAIVSLCALFPLALRRFHRSRMFYRAVYPVAAWMTSYTVVSGGASNYR